MMIKPYFKETGDLKLVIHVSAELINEFGCIIEKDSLTTTYNCDSKHMFNRFKHKHFYGYSEE